MSHVEDYTVQRTRDQVRDAEGGQRKTVHPLLAALPSQVVPQSREDDAILYSDDQEERGDSDSRGPSLDPRYTGGGSSGQFAASRQQPDFFIGAGGTAGLHLITRVAEKVFPPFCLRSLQI